MADDPRVTVELLDRDNLAVKAVLSEARGKQWQDVLNDTGYGKVILQNDDPDLVLVEYGDFLRFTLDGDVRFLSIVEGMHRVDITAAEEVDYATEISGRGALAYLEDAVVYPDFWAFDNEAPFADARAWNFAAFDAISDINSPPYDFGDRLATPGNYQNLPADFPPVFSHWLGGQAPDGSGDNPVGDWYFLALVFGLPTDLYRLYIGYDDAIDLWIDNVPILQNEGSTIDVTKTVDLFLNNPVVMWIAARVSNRSNPSPNPSAVTMALCTLNPDGSPDVEWWNTDPADPNIYVAPYPPSPPAFTAGWIVNSLCKFEPTTLRGALPLITMGFDELVDSNGDAWTEDINPSFQMGADCLTVVKTLSESYFDVWLDPATFTLNLYQTRGGDSGVSFTEAEDITELTHVGTF